MNAGHVSLPPLCDRMYEERNARRRTISLENGLRPRWRGDASAEPGAAWQMRNMLRMDSDDHRETARLEAFSDGVIAIAITLLVLEIRVPHIEGATPDALWSALRDLWPNYLGFLISFATIGIMWANHHTIFRLIAHTNHHLILANLLFLFFVAATPFPTALMADNLGRPAERVGIIVYSGWFLLTALSYCLLWFYASAGNRLIDPAASPDAVRALTSRYRVGPPAYGLAFLMAFVSPLASLALLLGLALAYVLPYSGTSRQAEFAITPGRGRCGRRRRASAG